MNQNKILIIDVETTGFSSKDSVVEIGIVELDIVTGEKKILFDKVVKSKTLSLQRIKDSWIVEKGFMSVNEIVDGENLDLAIINVQNILMNYPKGATAYNNEFDFRFLERAGIVFPRKLPCPMKLSTPLCKLSHPSGRKGYKWPTVQEAWNHFFGKNTGYIEKHRGADDAFHEADIVFELIKRGIFRA